MKRNFWIYLLVFSLALNLGGLATYVYMRYQTRGFWRESAPQKLFQEMWGSLNLEPGQKQALESLLPEHRRRVRELREGLAQKRRELFEITKEGTDAWPAMQAKVKEVSALQGQLEAEVLRFCLAFQEHLKPEQKGAFIMFVERRMINAQGGRGRRSPRWKSDMGVGPPQVAKPCGP
ncbi:MAG: periplasmic heavy metal sensor [Syntrophobacterales bacterium]|jgi:Spy/CpxP family protein refolding chaperone|nr:periplasmic heavy metal sensor [Syntrophobacterales bacterium]